MTDLANTVRFRPISFPPELTTRESTFNVYFASTAAISKEPSLISVILWNVNCISSKAPVRNAPEAAPNVTVHCEIVRSVTPMRYPAFREREFL